MVNAFSFCLFGCVTAMNHRVYVDTGLEENIVKFVPAGYYDGLDENIRLIERHFPGWRVYVFLGADVPDWFETFLQTKYPFVQTRRTGVLGYENTVHRFFAIDEPDVDVVFFRDTDSRVHWKDRWAIQNFMSQYPRNVHIIRDHPEHKSKIAAGTWGIRKGLLKETMRDLYAKWTPVHVGSGDENDVRGYGIDQNFLVDVIYPLVEKSIFVTHSNGYVLPNELAVEFPFEWTNDMYVGRVEGKPVTENFWLRERDAPPPQIHPVVMPMSPPPPPSMPKPERRTPYSFLRHVTSGNAS